jgi:hypothetical protein
MCLVNGNKPNINEFKQSVANRNLNNLTIWHNVGLDVANGEYAIFGARLGTYMTMLTDWDYTKVQWFDDIAEVWQKNEHTMDLFGMTQISDTLSTKLGLPMCTLTTDQSKFFKRHYNSDKHNLGPLVREMDVIRQIEGW